MTLRQIDQRIKEAVLWRQARPVTNKAIALSDDTPTSEGEPSVKVRPRVRVKSFPAGAIDNEKLVAMLKHLLYVLEDPVIIEVEE
jgi:hypothetical protein